MSIDLSVVVIGRNEGLRLSSCLQSIKRMTPCTESIEYLYVDSASTDDSVARALEEGFTVIYNDVSRTTAAAARNLGRKAARGKIILFLDGDTLLQPDFVKTALPVFVDPSVAIVCGHRRELHPEASIYQYVLDKDWVYPTGYVDACGGDALIRRRVLEEVDGYDESLIAGEEPEMCKRIRSLHYRVYRLDSLMTLHDLHIHSFGQYWTRCFRTGYAYAAVSHRLSHDKDPLWLHESRRNMIKGSLLLFALIISPWTLIPLFVSAAAAVALILSTAVKSKSPTYALHAHFQHIPMLVGQIAFWLDRMRAKRRSLIEYK